MPYEGPASRAVSKQHSRAGGTPSNRMRSQKKETEKSNYNGLGSIETESIEESKKTAGGLQARHVKKSSQKGFSSLQ
jgi:hypothetical protein